MGVFAPVRRPFTSILGLPCQPTNADTRELLAPTARSVQKELILVHFFSFLRQHYAGDSTLRSSDPRCTTSILATRIPLCHAP